jgi:uncharacterized protein YacL
MIVGIIVRILGAIVLGFGGWRLGQYLSSVFSPDMVLQWVVPLTMAGAILGALIAPWVTIRPIEYLRRRIQELPTKELLSVIGGLIVGLLIAALLTPVLAHLPSPFGDILPFVAAVLFGYLGIVVMTMRRKDIFALVGSRFTRGEEPPMEERQVLLDTSVIIDGRIADVSQTGFIMATMVVPRFVLNELQHIADSPDSLRRNRGRRGLEILNRLKEEPRAPVRFTDMDVPEARDVDDKLVMLAKTLQCPVITNDYNLNRVAQLQGVQVLNINELANAVKTVLLPGETIPVKIIQEGKELGQGVGYLDDGTMIVVEEGRPYIGQTVSVLVKKVLQKTEGRLVFAQPDQNS